MRVSQAGSFRPDADDLTHGGAVADFEEALVAGAGPAAGHLGAARREFEIPSRAGGYGASEQRFDRAIYLLRQS